ncbi:MAG: formylglycine-generating enzyme family protein [Planctomycetota bacterium]
MQTFALRHSAHLLALCSPVAAQMVTFCPPNANSTGSGATLSGAIGTVLSNRLHLEVTGGVPNEFGYFLVGDQASPANPISMGMLCLGGAGSSVYRYNLSGTVWSSLGQFNAAGTFVNVVGTSVSGTGFEVPGTIPDGVFSPILLGETWHFQLWYRDSAAQAGSSNFSNGLSVTFNPPGTPIAGMVPIPAGTFQMGSSAPPGAPYHPGSNEHPVHTVTISQSFWMSATEVTQAQYQALMGANPSFFSGGNRPVEQVTWNNARAYCAALTAQELAFGNVPNGFEYRLPTEAEWEYACRGGTTTEFHYGDALYCDDGNFDTSLHSGEDCYSLYTVNVGSYSPNAFGLYDMHGNVSEWCLDSYAVYGAGAASDPFVTGGPYRVLRGGSWNFDSSLCRSPFRNYHSPAIANYSFGFRVVLAPIRVP